jgi:hypothetical protein
MGDDKATEAPPQALSCERCGQPMIRIAAMPRLTPDGKGASVYRCGPCDAFKWIEELG